MHTLAYIIWFTLERPPVLGKPTENGFHSSILVPLFFVVLHIACLPHSNEGHTHVLVSELCTRNGVDLFLGTESKFFAYYMSVWVTRLSTEIKLNERWNTCIFVAVAFLIFLLREFFDFLRYVLFRAAKCTSGPVLHIGAKWLQSIALRCSQVQSGAVNCTQVQCNEVQWGALTTEKKVTKEGRIFHFF